MDVLFKPLWSPYPYITPIAIADILLVALLIYHCLNSLRGRRAAHILTGFGVLILIYAFADLLGFELLRTILAQAAPYVPFALIVMFQSELRRLLARIGRTRWLPNFGSRLQQREFAAELVLSLGQLSQQRTGALIVLERDIGLRTFIESGVRLDALLSRDLLLTVFRNGSVLHDGAVIVQGDRVAAAACFLPLSIKPALARSMGTRHRAAIGVTEETDCLSLVVSEETGKISLAAFGEIELDIRPADLQKRILGHLSRRRWTSESLDSDEAEPEMAKEPARTSLDR